MNKTIENFCYQVPKEMKNRISCNISEKKREKIILDLFQLYFDFSKKEITVEYYVEDDSFPTTIISFDDFKKLCE